MCSWCRCGACEAALSLGYLPESLFPRLRLMTLRNGSGCAYSEAYLIFGLVTEFAKKKEAKKFQVWHRGLWCGTVLLGGWLAPACTGIQSQHLEAGAETAHLLYFSVPPLEDQECIWCCSFPSEKIRCKSLLSLRMKHVKKWPFLKLDLKADLYCEKNFPHFTRSEHTSVLLKLALPLTYAVAPFAQMGNLSPGRMM